MQAVGAPTVDYSLKTKCCGGSLTGTLSEVGLRLNYILLKEAARKGAQAIVTICPLCQFNLDVYQNEIARQSGEKFDMPILYFTQVLGWALGAEDAATRPAPVDFGPGSDSPVVRGARGGRGLCLRITAPSESGFTSATAAPTSPAVVDVQAVAEYRRRPRSTSRSRRDYKYMCSDPGQELIRQDIRDHRLNRVVVASCSPHLHEHTFRTARSNRAA